MKMADDTTARRGREAEMLAASYLADHGLRILANNFRVRGGEIDLICQDGGWLVFVEVRLRTHGGFGGARDSITRSKQQRIILAARHYLARQKRDWPCRFDCVLLDDVSYAGIEWVKHAFELD